jgi:hypothetical protein
MAVFFVLSTHPSHRSEQVKQLRRCLRASGFWARVGAAQSSREQMVEFLQSLMLQATDLAN